MAPVSYVDAQLMTKHGPVTDHITQLNAPAYQCILLVGYLLLAGGLCSLIFLNFKHLLLQLQLLFQLFPNAVHLLTHVKKHFLPPRFLFFFQPYFQ